MVKEFDSRKKMEINLKQELRYFAELLKKKGKTKMVVDREQSQWDTTTTTVKLTQEGIVKESASAVFSFGSAVAWRVTLKPNGSLQFQEVFREKPENPRATRRF
jgi:hypothetical protein